MAAPPLLEPELIARVRRYRLGARLRVEGRYAGAHASRRLGSSVDFVDHRAYAPGDDPRRVDWHARARLGKLLVKRYEAEDEAALRVVLDLSGSMGFGAKGRRAGQLAVALVAVATAGADRARVLTAAGDGLDAGPWYRGPAGLPAADMRVAAASPSGVADLPAALRRAHGEGGRGPVVLVSDLLFDGWAEALRALAAGGGDTVLLHLLGRTDLEPDLEGDVRLVDAETGEQLEVGLGREALSRFAAVRDAWLSDVDRTAASMGIAAVRHVDDEDLEELLTTALPSVGLIA